MALTLATLPKDCIAKAYPLYPAVMITSAESILPASTTNPIFYGCSDWHSAVHSHWLLAAVANR